MTYCGKQKLSPFLFVVPLCVLLVAALRPIQSAPTPEAAKAAARGLDHLLHRSYGVPVVTQAEYDRLWTVWDPEWKARAQKDPAQIRQLTLERYGFTPSLDPQSAAPLQLVSTTEGLVINCLTCHGGRVPGTGQILAGMPNTEIDLATFMEDVNRLRGTSSLPAALFGRTRGHTNAVFMSHVLLMFRNPDLSMRKSSLSLGAPKIFDMDAPAWWNIKKKRYLYCDALLEGGFARTMMQFAMGAGNGAAMCDWEPDFDDILAYIDSMEPPKYPCPIDHSLADQGKGVFDQRCAGCHGTYGPQGKYPDVVVPIDQVGIDPVRLHGISPEMERYYATTWFAQKSKARNGVEGYAVPPLDGIWATAPYFHNGSVPTLYGVMTASARPKYFRRVGGTDAFDRKDVGLQIEALDGPAPADLTSSARRRVVDTTVTGMSNQGHPFGFGLTEAEKRAVIEYLKTL